MEFVGKTIGNFRIDRLLGEGGIGAVYQAYDPSLQRDVAIKVIPERFSRLSNFRERFQRELRAAVAAEHPGLVKVHDFGQHMDQLYIVMEYLRGANLRQLLDELILERTWLPLIEAVLLVEQLCQTLEYADHHRLLHRDIDPANLMLKPEPVGELPFRVVLTDLGLAKLLEGQEITLEASFLGTPAYMSPEGALGLETGPHSDVYSLGILLYELAVGLLPFPIKTITEALRYHTREPVPAPRSIRPDMPEALERVILKALEKEPGNRYPSAAELATALAETIGGSAGLAGLDSGRAVSLLTKYKESLITSLQDKPSGPGKESSPGKTELPSPLIPGSPEILPKVRSSIEVLSKGKKPQVFTPQTETVSVGRDQDNQLVILDPEVSRRHVQINWDGSNYYVTDLKSRNGSFLGNVRLQPDMPKIWEPSQVLRVGDTALRLISHAQPGVAMEGFGAGPVGALVTPQQLTVEAGGSATASIALLNRSPNPDHFSLSLIGIPNSWVTNLPSRVELNPGSQKEIAFSLNVPRSPQSRAGRRSITIRVISQQYPTQFVDLKLTLTIAAYSEFQAELQPEHLRTGEIGRLSITNQGNLQETFTVQFTDAAEELLFQPPQLQLHVPEGGSATAEFQAGLRQQRWLGGEKSHAFSAQVSQPKGETQSLQADLLSRALIPIWVVPIAVLFCLLFAGSAAALFNTILPTPTPSLTPTLGVTLTPSPTPDPGAPTVEEWCVYPSDQAQTSFTDCPIQVTVAAGQTLNIRWRVSNAEEVIIDPLGNQDLVGSSTYLVTESLTAISLKAKNAEQKEIQKTIQIIVVRPSGNTSIAITTHNPDPSVVGQTVIVQYSLSTAAGSGTPTGIVIVSDGTVSCTGAVAAGQCSLTFISAGTRNLTATYAGDNKFTSSISPIRQHQVNKIDTTTTISSMNPEPSTIGQAVTVNFRVSVNAPGTGTPTGNVTISDGVDSCIGTVTAGSCSITLRTPGARRLTATYSGDTNFNGSTSAGQTHTVNKIGTTATILSNDPNPSVVGQAVTVRYSLAPAAGSGTPTGNVTVSDGTTSCTASVAAGQCQLTFASAGSKSLTATYAGDDNYIGSTSPSKSHLVKANSTTTIKSDLPDPSASNEEVTVIFTVTSTSSGTPTGVVTVIGDGTISCTASVAVGQCKLTFTGAGPKSLIATYDGDQSFGGSISSSESHLVNDTAPGAFTKTSPADGATVQSTSLTLSWGTSTGATSYEYCYDTVNNDTCSEWNDNGTSISKELSSLTPDTIYYWQVRAKNNIGFTYSDGSESEHWSFSIEPP